MKELFGTLLSLSIVLSACGTGGGRRSGSRRQRHGYRLRSLSDTNRNSAS